MVNITVGQRGVITLPKKLREKLGFVEGEVLSAYEKDGALVLKTHTAKTDPVLESIRRGLEDIKHGRYIEFGSIEELDKKLKEWRKKRRYAH